MSQSIIKDKSYSFALRIIRLYKFLTEEKHEFVLSKQVLLAGMSIGEHVKEALQSESRAEFAHQQNVALKQASKTEYWLQLLKDAEFIEPPAFDSINADCVELIKLLTSIVKTSRQNQK